MFKNLAVFIAFSCAPMQAVTQHSDHDWKTYTNVRFRYAICYPSDLLEPQGEAANSDGQKFSGKSGETLLVFGSNALGRTLLQDEENAAKRLKAQSGDITYEKHLSHWYVLSGHNGSSTFYIKTFLSNDEYKTFQLTYNSALGNKYNTIVTQLSRCFTDLHGGGK